MATVSESRLVHVKIPHLNGMVHRARQKEISSVMESNFPHGLPMLLVSLSAAGVNKVPDLDITITRCGSEQVTSRVEVTSSDPVGMAFSTHYKVSIGYGPKLPGSVIGGSGYNIFLRVVTDGGNAHQVAFKRFLVAEVRANSFITLI